MREVFVERVIIWTLAIILGCAAGLAGPGCVLSEQPAPPSDLDGRVSRFLAEARDTWTDLNVPYEDGQILFDLVLKGRFRNILEIGTSTGHSTIWLAWAASKTGGRVTTIEIDKARHETALDNFRKAGVLPYIDARLADAHELVPRFKGQFDFVFCDADKEWYLTYFLDIKPKMAPHGCFAAHNVLRNGGPEVAKFVRYVKGLAGFRTVIERGSGEGISVTCKE
jgi:caffeoyl-CoA O-methyltransferase